MKNNYKESYLEYFKTYNEIKSPQIIVAFSRIIIGFIILLLLFLVITPWVQTAEGIGKVTTYYPQDRLQNINALVDGRVKKWYVRDGVKVKKNQPLVEIVDNDPQLYERLEINRDAKIRKFEASKIATETSEINFIRQKYLFKRGLSSRKQFENAKIKYKTLKSKQAEVASELAQAEVELSRQSSQLVLAPSDGFITHIMAGDSSTFIKKGDVLASFTPENSKQALELYISGLDVPLVTEGRKVRLIFEGWPSVQFSGWPSVAIGTFGGVVKSVDPSVSSNGKFRVIIVEDETETEKWPNQNFLKYGAKTRGWILLDTVSIGYEFWRRLNNFPSEYDIEKNQKMKLKNENN